MSVSERDTRHRLAAAKVHCETLFFASLASLCQPVIGSLGIGTMPLIDIQRLDVFRWKPFTRFGVTLLKSLGAMITGALDYLLRVTCSI